MDWSYGQDRMLSSLELLERHPSEVRYGWFYHFCNSLCSFCCCRET